VEARYQLWQARKRFDPTADDPLFRSIDADDFGDDFTTLRTKALVRVVLPLPVNVVLADDPTATTVAVWRSVPTVANVAITRPFQADGRLGTLPEQALSAMRAHSEVTQDPTDRVLRRLANFQEHLFSSTRVRNLAHALATNGPPSRAEPPLNRIERAGKATFTQFCGSCHGGPAQTTNTDARFLPLPQRGPLGGAQAFVNVSVQTPRQPPFFDEVPSAGLPERTYVVTTPDGGQRQLVTSDPGRGLITGDVREFGRFDVPTLFGIRRTAPYFHDNSARTLEDVVKHYQALFELLTFFGNQGLFAPARNGQGCDADACGFVPLPDEQVPGLLAYLRKL
jgi:cytochrome c peroxidase